MSKLFKGISEVIVCYDNDDAGRNGALKLCQLIGFRAKRWQWSEDKFEKYDINDLSLECKSKERFVKEIEILNQSAITEGEPILKCSLSSVESLKQKLNLESKGEIAGIATGFNCFDHQFSGLDGITLLGGMPKGGKTTFTLNIAINTAEQGIPTIYMDFENGKLNLLRKIISNVFKQTTAEIRSNYKEIFDPLKDEKGHAKLQKILTNLFFTQPSRKDVPMMYAMPQEASNHILEKYVNCIRDDFGYVGPILFIIDSLQKLPAWATNDRRFSLDCWLRSFEWIRNQYNVSFLIISELTRGNYKKPVLEAFKESGDIEYTADLALILVNHEEVIHLHTVANRNGEVGEPIKYQTDFKYCKLNEISGLMLQRRIRNDKK